MSSINLQHACGKETAARLPAFEAYGNAHIHHKSSKPYINCYDIVVCYISRLLPHQFSNTSQAKHACSRL
jgi:hypothetical protein